MHEPPSLVQCNTQTGLVWCLTWYIVWHRHGILLVELLRTSQASDHEMHLTYTWFKRKNAQILRSKVSHFETWRNLCSGIMIHMIPHSKIDMNWLFSLRIVGFSVDFCCCLHKRKIQTCVDPGKANILDGPGASWKAKEIRDTKDTISCSFAYFHSAQIGT